MSNSASWVRTEIEGAVATITLARSERMNAFDVELHKALRCALDAVASDDAVKVIILTGEGRAFSSGQDLQERASVFEAGGVPDISGSLERNYNPLIARLATMPIPVIAAVNGMAFGAGAAIAIACDIAVAAHSARFQFGFVNVGLGPDSGASWNLPRLVGLQRAMDLVMSGRPVDAHEAERIGLVARSVEDNLLMSEVSALAKLLAKKPMPALRAIKAQMRGPMPESLEAALAAECVSQTQLGLTAEYHKAVMRFASRDRSET